jgi:hypothetical protein
MRVLADTAVDVADAPNASTRTDFGVADRCPQGLIHSPAEAVRLLAGFCGLLANGVATLKFSALSAGSHALTAVYNNPDGNFTTSTSTAVTRTVNRAHTSTTRTSSAQTATYGQPMTFTATVLPRAAGAGVPTGTVTFMDGSVVLGTVNAVNGVAQLITSTLARGKHGITAAYNGDADFLGSTSAVPTETISR